MAITLANIRTKIVETETAIKRVKTAIEYNDGDVAAKRVELSELEASLSRSRASEAQLEARAAGGKKSSVGIVTPRWS